MMLYFSASFVIYKYRQIKQMIMGILDDIDIALEHNDRVVGEFAFQDIRRQARDFIKKYCQYGDADHDIYWDDYVIDNNIWGKKCVFTASNIVRVAYGTYQSTSFDYIVNFRALKHTSKIGECITERKYTFIGNLVYGPISKKRPCEVNQNAVYATTFESDHDCDSIILVPRTNSFPIVIKGYPGKQLPEWLMFEKSTYKAQGYRRTTTNENHISFLLINCSNLTKQEVINHVINPDKTDIYVDIIETY